MFDGADIYSDDIATGGSAVRKPVSRPMAEVFALPEGGSSVEPQAVPRETSRYGEGRRMNVTAIVGGLAAGLAAWGLQRALVRRLSAWRFEAPALRPAPRHRVKRALS